MSARERPGSGQCPSLSVYSLTPAEAPGQGAPDPRTGSRLSDLLPVILLLAAGNLAAANLSPSPSATIPRVSRPPALEDYAEMEPNHEADGAMAKVEGFIQREPSDGQPASQRTEVYLGYDAKNFYAVFVCFDTDPGSIRARRVPRESTSGDDLVELWLDTFSDRRRAYLFRSNPLGIQSDAIWTEGQGTDFSFDTLWHSRGHRTQRGYVVWMAIPFKSLRFSDRPEQAWGVILRRAIPRVNESSFWPAVSSRVEGRLNQAAALRGLEEISPGRNIQFIPYGAFRSFRALDAREATNPRFVRDRAEADVGLDAKFVFKDSLVLDVTLNPDFAQVESDEPQVTVNQRFEVFFPEKRPFFIENANYFQTPINLLFTRRIADPQYGGRLTGKQGPYALGAFLIDDESPGKRVPPSDPLHGKRALYGIVRVSRDLFRQSSLGFLYTGREFEQTYNRVAGLDARFKLGENWVASGQAATSATRCLPPAERDRLGGGVDFCFPDDPERLAGPAYDFELTRSGRSFRYQFEYNDRGRGFHTAPGFLRRRDIRRFGQRASYTFRPEGRHIISWGPNVFADRVSDHDGTRLDWTVSPAFEVEFVGEGYAAVWYTSARERLRPQDFAGLLEPLDYPRSGYGIVFESSYFPQVSVGALVGWGKGINLAPPTASDPSIPPERRLPFSVDENSARLNLTVRPLTSLRIDNNYLLFRLTDPATGASILTDHIVRTKWNYQFTRELSLRVILQYDATLTNEPLFTSLETRKNFNADFLLTYLLHPGTALFIGYNGNAQNLDLFPTATGAELFRPRQRFVNDAKQFFIKFSYLVRF